MAVASSTASKTVVNTAAVVASTASSHSEGVTSAQSSATVTNQIMVNTLSKEQRIADLALKTPKQLSLMLRKAKEKGNTDKIAEIEAARAIRHIKHEKSTGQKVNPNPNAASSSAASDSAASAKNDDSKNHKTAEADSKKAKAGNGVAPNVQPATVQKYKTDVSFAKLVISLAIDDSKALEQLEMTDASNAETYRMARSLRHPFLEEEKAMVEMARMMRPNDYRGAKCNADVFKNIIASDLTKPISLLRQRLTFEKQFDASCQALTLLAIEKQHSH